MLRPDGGGAWRVVRSSEPVTLPGPAGIHEFAANLPIAPGDRVAVSATEQYQGWTAARASLDVWSGSWGGGDLLDQADIGAPPNQFAFGKPKINRKRGKAKRRLARGG